MNEMIKDELLKNEQILWSGQPKTSVIFTNADMFLVPFSLLWGGFAIFWEFMALSTGNSGHKAPAMFPIFGLPTVTLVL